VGGKWSVGGDGHCQIQRVAFKGICPVQVLGGTKGNTSFLLSSCVFDKSQLAGNLVRVILFNYAGVDVGFNTSVYDPSVLGGTTTLTSNRAGCGSVGGDGSQLATAFDINVSRCVTGGVIVEGSYFNSMLFIDSGYAVINSGSKVKALFVNGGANSSISGFTVEDAYFGGLIPIGLPFSPFAGITVIDGATLFLGNNVDISNAYGGIYARRAACHVQGTLSGAGNTTYGAVIKNQSALFFEPGLAVVTLTGGFGDLAWDVTVPPGPPAPVAGGFAGILAGTPVFDALRFSMATLQSAAGA
jgi:hypothetical protein